MDPMDELIQEYTEVLDAAVGGGTWVPVLTGAGILAEFARKTWQIAKHGEVEVE